MTKIYTFEEKEKISCQKGPMRKQEKKTKKNAGRLSLLIIFQNMKNVERSFSEFFST